MFLKSKQKDISDSLTRQGLKRFKRNKLSMAAFYYILFCTTVFVLGYLITPDKTPYANKQYLELSTKKPGFSVNILTLGNKENQSIFKTMLFGKKQSIVEIPLYSYKFEGKYLITEEYSGDIPNDGIKKTYLTTNLLYSIDKSKPFIIDKNKISFTDIDNKKHIYNDDEINLIVEKEQISKSRFILGTDRFGRDVLSQLIIGTRVSLSVGFISVLISLVVGIFFGSLAGYYRGKIDSLIMWFINVIWSIPTLLLVIAITFALGKGFWQVFIAVGLTMWVEVARVVRGQILSLREKEFIEAARALGYSNTRIIYRHILPNVMGPVIVISAANFASAILLEAGLSFLGLGVQPPTPSWGSMIKENYGYIITDYAYLAILPGIVIMFLVLAFMLIGNGLRDALDVKETR